jgi:hypothetical protein
LPRQVLPLRPLPVQLQYSKAPLAGKQPAPVNTGSGPICRGLRRGRRDRPPVSE